MSDVQLIKDKLDIVSFISEYVELKPSGINHKGRCPFHNEKTPSFMVNRERQRWHCFGCAKGGDIFTFIQEIEGMDFPEALKFLAGKAGIELTERFGSNEEKGQKTRLKEIMVEAVRFYHNVLTKLPLAEPARAYLKKRGVLPETIDAWQIGYSSDQWDLLTSYLLKKGYSVDDLIAAGLTIQREGAVRGSSRGFYDRFRGRVMFPISDIHGAPIGFTGRVLVETEQSGGKYVNTPQTTLYDKSRVVFGLHRAKQAIRSSGLIVMVEGQMDVIACHEAGMENVVATSGTAMTEHQVALLKRYAEKMAIAFDADAAGQAAAKRGIDIALGEGVSIQVIRIPDGQGKDPDECIRQDKTNWFTAVQEAQDIMAWYLDRAIRGKDLRSPKGKQAAANEMLTEIAKIPYAVERDHWLRELSGRIEVDVSVLREDMERFKKQAKTTPVKQETQAAPSTTPSPKELPRLTSMIERFFALFLRFPQALTKETFTLSRTLAETTTYLPLYDTIKQVYTTDIPITPDALRPTVASDPNNFFDVLLLRGELDFSLYELADARHELLMMQKHIHDEWRTLERRRILTALGEAEREGNTDRMSRLLSEMQSLNSL